MNPIITLEIVIILPMLLVGMTLIDIQLLEHELVIPIDMINLLTVATLHIWLWLDKVNKVYGVMGCTDEQRVLFSSFLMEDRAKDWWDAVERRYPDGISWDQFQQNFTHRFFPQSHKDSKIEEFFKLEQKNMSVSEYEKKFLELVRLVPYIQADEVLKCKRSLLGLQHRIRVHLSVIPHNRFGDLVEAALRVKQSTTAMYQSRQKNKRSAPGDS